MSIKRGYRDNQNLNRVMHVIITYFFIKSLCIEPRLVERKNRFIFQNKNTFDAFSLNTAKIEVFYVEVVCTRFCCTCTVVFPYKVRI